MKCSSLFSCPIIIIAKLGLLVCQKKVSWWSAELNKLRTQEGSLIELKRLVIGIHIETPLPDIT
jgi:hypothetical protein